MRKLLVTKKLLPGVVLLVVLFGILNPAQSQTTAAQRRRAWITILSTTDLHGNILPVDYYTNKADVRGLAKVGLPAAAWRAGWRR